MLVLPGLVGCGVADVLPGEWRDVRAETRTVDVNVEADGTERVAADVTVFFDGAHDFTFDADGAGDVTTRAFFNLVSGRYLALDAETVTSLAWALSDDDATLTLTSDDGVGGDWDVSSDDASNADAALTLSRVARQDFGAERYAERTTTLLLQR